jgi:hypothetical protein
LRTASEGAGDPSVMLEDEIFGSGIIFVGDGAGRQDELLLRFEGVGGGNKIGGQTARKKVARRAGSEQKQRETEN